MPNANCSNKRVLGARYSKELKLTLEIIMQNRKLNFSCRPLAIENCEARLFLTATYLANFDERISPDEPVGEVGLISESDATTRLRIESSVDQDELDQVLLNWGEVSL